MFNPNNVVRNNIRNLKPYSSARDEFKGEANIFLDANENSLGSPLLKWYNRYPDPMQWKIKQKLSVIKQVPVDQIFLGNGSDEPIDLLFRCFCEPGVDEALDGMRRGKRDGKRGESDFRLRRWSGVL